MKCSNCNGEGKINVTYHDKTTEDIECPECDSTGQVDEEIHLPEVETKSGIVSPEKGHLTIDDLIFPDEAYIQYGRNESKQEMIVLTFGEKLIDGNMAEYHFAVSLDGAKILLEDLYNKLKITQERQ